MVNLKRLILTWVFLFEKNGRSPFFKRHMEKWLTISNYAVSVDVIDLELPNREIDSAWIYVSIIGEGDGEAVTVIVSNENGRYLIQELEWGRP